MKKQLLLIMFSLIVTSWAYGQATINCFPATSDYNTGSLNSTDFTETSLIKTTAGLVEAGYAKFDISNIPAGATIQNVVGNFYIAQDDYTYWNAVAIDSDPLVAEASDLWAEITVGGEFIYYAQHSGFNFPEPDWWIADLGPNAVTDLQENLDNLEGWFAVGIWEYEQFGTYYITCDGWNETNQPFIEVTYLVAGAPLPAFNPNPADEEFNIEPETDLTWDFGASTEMYDLYFGTDFPPLTKVVDNESSGVSGTYDPGTLEFQTTYYWQVVSKNSTAELETPGPIWSFTTKCDAWAVPIIENFDEVTTPEMPYCWFKIQESINGFSYVNTINNGSYSPPNCVYMYNSDDVNPSVILVSPQMEEPINQLWINFFAWGPELSIGTMSDPTDASTYTEFATIVLSNVYLDYQEYELSFDSYSGTDEYIALKGVFQYTYQGIYIDNIIIDHPPSCPKPDDLYAINQTTNAVTLGWTEMGSATIWNMEYGIAGFTPTGTGNAVANSNPFDLTGLDPATAYEYYVQADCGEGDVSYWVGPLYFKTTCEATTVPYFEGFEDAVIPAPPDCIDVENVNEDTKFWYTANNDPYDGLQVFRVNYNGTLAMDDWFYSAPLDLIGNTTYVVQFYYTSNSSSYIERLEVKWGEFPNSIAMTSDAIFKDTLINYAFEYHFGVGYFTPPTDGVYFVGWHGYSIPNQFDIYVDNILIEVAPSCLKPAGLYASTTATNSATLQWTENGDATIWNIEYGPEGFSPTGVPNATADSNPYELMSLDPATTYDVYIQADCGEGDVSWWEGPATFTTLCVPSMVPIFEDFNTVIVPELPVCWSKAVASVSGGADVYTYQWNSNSPPNSVNLYNSNDPEATILFISPLLADPINTLWINFFAFAYSSGIEVGAISNPLDVSTFFPIDTVMFTTGIWEEYEVFFSDYSGTDQFIAFKPIFTGGWQDTYLDDITIDHPPSCPKPSDIYASSATINSATLEWTENGDATLWNIEYGYKGFTPTGTPNAFADTNPYELMDLESSTVYDIYVQADCGEGDVSLWQGPATFATICEPFTVTVFENFDNLVTPEIPLCWSGIVESTSQWAFIESTQWFSYSAPNSIELYNSDDQFASLFLVSPVLSDPINTLWINFFSATDAWGVAEGIIVGTITNPLDASTFTPVDTVYYTTGGIFEEYEVFFTNYTGSDQFIAFKGLYYGTYQYCFIDEITIDHPPTCPKPSDLYANGATTNSVMLGWQENGSATQWNIEYGELGYTPTGVPNAFANSNPFELTGLEDGTMYAYYVQANCGVGDESYWVGPHMFQTLCFPASLPYEEGFEDVVIPLVPPCIVVENTNNDNRYWESSLINPYSGNYHMSIGWNGNLPMNDWFFSAPLELLGGQNYNVIFYYSSSSDWYYENLEVLWGTEPNANAMVDEPIWSDLDFSYNGVYQEAITSFSPDSNGVYFVGWHGFSDANQDFIYIDDIYIEWDNSLIVLATATPDEVCQGESTQLNGTAVGGSGSYTYTWTSLPAGFNSTQQNPIVTPTETTQYILDVYDGMVSVYDNVVVTMIPLPGTPGTPNGLTYICANWGNTTYSTSGATNATSYNWMIDPPEAGETSGTSTSVTIIWTEDFLGEVNLNVAGINDYCEGPLSNALSITRYLPDVALTPFDTACVTWAPFELTGGSPAGGTYSGTGVTDGWFDPATAGTGTHTITYTYQDIALCENSAEQDIVVDICTGINLPDGMRIGIIPNPSNGLFKVFIQSNITEKVNIKVINSQGVEVFEDLNVQLTNRYQTEVNLEQYSKGLYYLYINTSDATYIEKIIVN